MYWIDVCREMDKYVIGEFDTRQEDDVIDGKLKLLPGIYRVKASGSYYVDWTGIDLLNPSPLEIAIREAWDRKE